jgi:hypothetical protein
VLVADDQGNLVGQDSETRLPTPLQWGILLPPFGKAGLYPYSTQWGIRGQIA